MSRRRVLMFDCCNFSDKIVKHEEGGGGGGGKGNVG